MSKVKDMSLALGVRKIEWVQKHMPVFEHIKAEYEETQPFNCKLRTLQRGNKQAGFGDHFN